MAKELRRFYSEIPWTNLDRIPKTVQVATEEMSSVATEEMSSVATEEMSSVATEDISSVATQDISSVAAEDISSVAAWTVFEILCHNSLGICRTSFSQSACIDSHSKSIESI